MRLILIMTSKHIFFYSNLLKLLFFQTMGSGERVTSSDIVQVSYLIHQGLDVGCHQKKNRIYLILFFLVSSLFYLNRYSTGLATVFSLLCSCQFPKIILEFSSVFLSTLLKWFYFVLAEVTGVERGISKIFTLYWLK